MVAVTGSADDRSSAGPRRRTVLAAVSGAVAVGAAGYWALFEDGPGDGTATVTQTETRTRSETRTATDPGTETDRPASSFGYGEGGYGDHGFGGISP